VKGENGSPTCFKREIDPYVVELDEAEKDAYQKLRVANNTAEM